MQGEKEAIMKRPPRAAGVLDRSATHQVTLVAVTTSAAQVIGTPAAALPSAGAWLTLICTADTRLRFGVGDPGAATAADYLSLPAGQEREYWITEEVQFRAFSTLGGTLDWYISS